ncbi:hypothetical protein MHLP_03880 [Candidatus Mycoplasma haematolamae str. Purdue]|uniref:Uncharacterized protein n=1 Tax=Mycoplasma haematolamae (strain Purdue) TaxID=1212765 RepID=I7CGG2_MYCHA|nr:hypothetical protein [Candidatus Mycoplasma haematolamae]AFO52356.1 hypothetical protein MHLP_03880 [Candidatus Mycoplasma haematolamae str. Purdue]
MIGAAKTSGYILAALAATGATGYGFTRVFDIPLFIKEPSLESRIVKCLENSFSTDGRCSNDPEVQAKWKEARWE